MEQQLLNELYWPPEMNSSFNYGSQVRVLPNDEVVFTNRLVTPGVAIKHWNNQYNYQADKAIPQLPHLQVDHQYRLVLHANLTPAKSILVRLTFKDIQGTEIKRYDFTRSVFYFTVPKRTVNISLELVNAGNVSIDFKRIDICDQNLEQAANEDLWFQNPINYPSDRPLNLLVVPANRRVKKTFPLLKTYACGLPAQVLLVDYQYTGNLTGDLLTYLKTKKIFACRLVSCDSRFDVPLLNALKEMPTLQALVTTEHKERIDSEQASAYTLSPVAEWANSNLVEPNWRLIFNAVSKVTGGSTEKW